MKICIIASLYTPFTVGGAEVYVERISRRLSDNHQVILITASPFKNLDSLKPHASVKGKIKVYSFYPLNIYHSFYSPNKPVFLRPLWHALDIWNLHSYIMIGRILQRENPDIVHTHNLSGFSLSAVSIIKKLGLPLVHTCHDFSLICPYATFTCPFRKNIACRYPLLPCVIYRKFKKMIIDNKPDIIIFPSQFTFDTYLKNNFFKNSAKEILYNCIEPIKVELSKNLSDEYFNILYVGQLSQHKGVHVLIEAFKNLAYEKSKLHIVGDGDYESNLKKIAGGDTRIVFYGKVSNLDMGRFYHLADITVMPSLCQEVLGIVILESFSAGVPVIGSRIGGIPELIKDGHNGFIFKPGNHEELKSILEKIIFKRELLQQLKINALDSSRRFGIDAHIAGLEEIYKKAMGLNRSHITN